MAPCTNVAFVTREFGVLCVIISIKDENNFEALKLEDVLPNAGCFQHVLVDEALLDIENDDRV